MQYSVKRKIGTSTYEPSSPNNFLRANKPNYNANIHKYQSNKVSQNNLCTQFSTKPLHYHKREKSDSFPVSSVYFADTSKGIQFMKNKQCSNTSRLLNGGQTGQKIKDYNVQNFRSKPKTSYSPYNSDQSRKYSVSTFQNSYLIKPDNKTPKYNVQIQQQAPTLRQSNFSKTTNNKNFNKKYKNFHLYQDSQREKSNQKKQSAHRTIQNSNLIDGTEQNKSSFKFSIQNSIISDIQPYKFMVDSLKISKDQYYTPPIQQKSQNSLNFTSLGSCEKDKVKNQLLSMSQALKVLASKYKTLDIPNLQNNSQVSTFNNTFEYKQYRPSRDTENIEDIKKQLKMEKQFRTKLEDRIKLYEQNQRFSKQHCKNCTKNEEQYTFRLGKTQIERKQSEHKTLQVKCELMNLQIQKKQQENKKLTQNLRQYMQTYELKFKAIGQQLEYQKRYNIQQMNKYNQNVAQLQRDKNLYLANNQKLSNRIHYLKLQKEEIQRQFDHFKFQIAREKEQGFKIIEVKNEEINNLVILLQGQQLKNKNYDKQIKIFDNDIKRKDKQIEKLKIDILQNSKNLDLTKAKLAQSQLEKLKLKQTLQKQRQEIQNLRQQLKQNKNCLLVIEQQQNQLINQWTAFRIKNGFEDGNQHNQKNYKSQNNKETETQKLNQQVRQKYQHTNSTNRQVKQLKKTIQRLEQQFNGLQMKQNCNLQQIRQLQQTRNILESQLMIFQSRILTLQALLQNANEEVIVNLVKQYNRRYYEVNQQKLDDYKHSNGCIRKNRRDFTDNK